MIVLIKHACVFLYCSSFFIFFIYLLVFPFLQYYTASSLINYSGKIKRGTYIWKESLPEEIEIFIRNLSVDVVDGHRFIKVTKEAVLIGGTTTHFRKSRLPYVAYFNLTLRPLRIEYRTSLPAFVLMFLFLCIFPPMGALTILLNHRLQTDAIMDFIHEQMQKNRREIMPTKQSPSIQNKPEPEPELKPENPATITPRGRQILSMTTTAFTLNFMLFMVIFTMLGGSAITGYVENGHYYFTNHAVDTEVSEMVWTLSYMYTVATCLTFPLNVLVGLLLFVRGEIKLKW